MNQSILGSVLNKAHLAAGLRLANEGDDLYLVRNGEVLVHIADPTYACIRKEADQYLKPGPMSQPYPSGLDGRR
jgi:sulfur transfer complex TusBCD TusB component (DsrH family)